MLEINRRDADQAASAEADVYAAALAVGAEMYGAKAARCMGPLASSPGDTCPNLATQTSRYQSQRRALLLR